MGVTRTQRKNVKNWESYLENFFLKFPPLSKNVRETIVTIVPWISLILGILGIYATVKFSLLTFFSPFILPIFAFWGATGLIISGLLGLVASILLLAAFPGTKKRLYQGWKFLLWSEVVSIVSSVISFSLIGILISLVVFYLLYQIKSYYK